MKVRPQMLRGFTLIELLVVIALIVVIASLLLPALARAKEQARRIHCVSNLKQVALALKIYAQDHDGNYPWHTAPSDGGTYGTFAAAGWRNFYAASNDLVTPQILVCPSDATTRNKMATSWEEFSSPAYRSNALSFFTGLDGFEQLPIVMLAGDRNIAGGVSDRCGSVSDPPGVRAREFRAGSSARWTNGVHRLSGNIALTDGSVQRTDRKTLQEIVDASYRLLTNSVLSARNRRVSNHLLPPR